jgi:hypothetical protein
MSSSACHTPCSRQWVCNLVNNLRARKLQQPRFESSPVAWNVQRPQLMSNELRARHSAGLPAIAAARQLLETSAPDAEAIAAIVRANPQASHEIFILLKHTVPYPFALQVLSLATATTPPAEPVAFESVDDLPHMRDTIEMDLVIDTVDDLAHTCDTLEMNLDRESNHLS